jgi:hypothetical protein
VLLGFSAASRILVVCHFRNLAEENGIPCQNLINLYLRDCVEWDRKLNTKWE